MRGEEVRGEVGDESGSVGAAVRIVSRWRSIVRARVSLGIVSSGVCEMAVFVFYERDPPPHRLQACLGH